MLRFGTFLLVCTSILYPFAIWMGYEKYISILLFGLWLIKLISEIFKKQSQWKTSIFFCLFFLLMCVSNSYGITAMLYPCFINLGLCVAFAWSMRGEAMITRFARLEHTFKKLPNLNKEEIRYTRILTKIWAGFFVLNFSICLFLALCNMQKLWVFYSGIGGYVLVGILFLGERIFRKKLKGWLV